MTPLFLSPNPPSLSLLDAGRSRADFLFVVSEWRSSAEIGPLYF